MSLRWIFPTPILQADLNPNESQARAMQRQLEIFDRLAYQSDSNKNQKMLTGDKLGEIGLDQLHHSSSFEWLNQQLALQVKILMNELFGDKAALDVHIPFRGRMNAKLFLMHIKISLRDPPIR